MKLDELSNCYFYIFLTWNLTNPSLSFRFLFEFASKSWQDHTIQVIILISVISVACRLLVGN